MSGRPRGGVGLQVALQPVRQQTRDGDGSDARPALWGVEVVHTLQRVDPLSNRQAGEARREVDVTALEGRGLPDAQTRPDESLSRESSRQNSSGARLGDRAVTTVDTQLPVQAVKSCLHRVD